MTAYKKRILILVFVFGFQLLINSMCNAAIYYIDLDGGDDSSAGTWTDKSPSVPISNYPSIRQAPNMASIHGTDKVLMFGGYTTYYNYYGDTWVYDLSDNTWTKKTPVSGSPTGCIQAGMATIYGDEAKILRYTL